MTDPMEYFYADSVSLYDASSGGGYDDDIRLSFLRALPCDIQPQSGNLEAAQSGQFLTETVKIFCAVDEDVKPGRYVEANGVYYMISEVLKWRLGYEITALRRDISCE